MSLMISVENFIEKYYSGKRPLLLGLSGGPDSLALYYALLIYQKKNTFHFHVAHIDHGWRPESAVEAQYLQSLAAQSAIPFHLCTLDPAELKGNLEESCREARHRFFTDLCQMHQLEGVLLGHHQGDQSETVLKRIFEGANWSNLAGLQFEIEIRGLKIFRPLLQINKSAIHEFLKKNQVKAFEDRTNNDERFMRARMRQTLIPWLNSTFGKNIQPALIHLGQEMQEIDDFFDQRLSPLITQSVHGPFGVFLDLQHQLPSSLIEIKYLLRRFCESHALGLSRMQYQLCADALANNKANQRYECLKKTLYLDRRRIFLIDEKTQGNWKLELKEALFETRNHPSNLKEIWQGKGRTWLPQGIYQIKNWEDQLTNKKSLDKWWTNEGVPAGLRKKIPLICRENEVVHEFLTGRNRLTGEPGQKGIELCIHYKIC